MAREQDMCSRKKRKSFRGQTAVELAVFGAILIFVLGTILRSAVNRSNQQHSMLRATRMALTESYKHSESKKIASRNNASVMIVEDRLSVASGKFGAVDRAPLMSYGSGTHSANLFMPIDFGDNEDLGIMDLYVNGQHFAFSTAEFKKYKIAQKCANLTGADCHVDCKGDCSETSPQYRRHPDFVPADKMPGDLNAPEYWEDNCIKRIDVVRCANLLPCPAACGGDCTESSINEYEEPPIFIGCAKLYKIIDNHPQMHGWCEDSAACPLVCSDGDGLGCNLSVDERFDLDRNELDRLLGDVSVSGVDREGFSWQWGLVMGFDELAELKPSYDEKRLIGFNIGDPPSEPTPLEPRYIKSIELNKGEGIILPDGESEPKNISLDVDSDLKIEHVMMKRKKSVSEETGIITTLGVVDYQLGDIDVTYNDSDALLGVLPYGFIPDVNMYTYVRDGNLPGGGTYLQIDEGKLLLPGGSKQAIRTASRKDQVDIIERVYRLSRDRKTYCDGGSPVDFKGGDNIYRLPVNPVEACGDCFSRENMQKTCLEPKPEKGNNQPLIYIRSRIHSEIGHSWLTDTSTDEYIELKTE